MEPDTKSAEEAQPPADDAAAPATPQPSAEAPPKKAVPVQMIVLAVLTITTLAFAIYAARSM